MVSVALVAHEPDHSDAVGRRVRGWAQWSRRPTHWPGRRFTERLALPRRHWASAVEGEGPDHTTIPFSFFFVSSFLPFFFLFLPRWLRPYRVAPLAAVVAGSLSLADAANEVRRRPALGGVAIGHDRGGSDRRASQRIKRTSLNITVSLPERVTPPSSGRRVGARDARRRHHRITGESAAEHLGPPDRVDCRSYVIPPVLTLLFMRTMRHLFLFPQSFVQNPHALRVPVVDAQQACLLYPSPRKRELCSTPSLLSRGALDPARGHGPQRVLGPATLDEIRKLG